MLISCGTQFTKNKTIKTMAKQPKLTGESMEVFVNDYSFSTQTQNVSGGISGESQPTPETSVHPDKLINPYSLSKCPEGNLGTGKVNPDMVNDYSLSLKGRSLR